MTQDPRFLSEAASVDDLGRKILLTRIPTRIVSLVPSITELLFALDCGERVVGATPFCVEPAAVRSVPRVGGPKKPDITAIRDLEPDLVIANVEENGKEHVETLIAAGITVYVTFPRTVAAGIALVRKVGVLLGREPVARATAGRLEAARVAVAAEAASGPGARVFCPIWKQPWMTFNRDTFAHDMLATAGGQNVCAGLVDRYPVVNAEVMAELRPEVVLLPSEPYSFGPGDLSSVQELLAGSVGSRARVGFIDGRALTWYGARIDWGLRLLRAALISVRAEEPVG